MNQRQLLELVVRPTLHRLALHTPAAEQLVMGTIAQESHAEYLQQLGGGPALGLAQMEPATHRDIWRNFIRYRSTLKTELLQLLSVEAAAKVRTTGAPLPVELIGNLVYAVAMCRVHYLRAPQRLPEPGDVPALAAYWKRYYNTVLGAGSEAEFIDNFPATLFE